MHSFPRVEICYPDDKRLRRFWSLIDKSDGCWIWKGATDSAGYGKFHIQTGRVSAHRLSYFLRFGPIPEGLLICHKCNIPLCVNPNHLYAGTYKDNRRDIDNNGYKPPSGSAHPNSRIAFKDVLEIHRLYYEEGINPSPISKRFNITVDYVRGILRGKYWKEDFKSAGISPMTHPSQRLKVPQWYDPKTGRRVAAP